MEWRCERRERDLRGVLVGEDGARGVGGGSIRSGMEGSRIEIGCAISGAWGSCLLYTQTRIKSSIAEVCNALNTNHTTVADFNGASLSLLESGRCSSRRRAVSHSRMQLIWNADCRTWIINQTVLCTHCNSCCAGALKNVKFNWLKVAIANIIVLIFLFIYSCGCRAYRNSKRSSYSKGLPLRGTSHYG